jgi:2-polyprenyl-6-methoxyphenol hydroxylase-like FAD-dependent oxidoreductase
MLLENKQIAIVGGGPGGLTLARLLQLKNVAVKVYERDADETTRQQGATLDLHEESGLEALRRANLVDEFYANYRPDAGKLRILNKDAAIKMDDHTAKDFGDQRPEIDRAPFRDVLIQSLKPNTIVWNSQFVSMESHNSGWLLHFKNGNTFFADIVIGADGANSKIRPYITDIKPIYSGITIVEGNVYHAEKNAPKLWELVSGGKVFAFGDEQSLILSAKGEGSLSFYTGCKVAENWVEESTIDFNNKEQVFSWFKTAFGSWNEVYQELFASDELWFVPRPQYHFPLDQTWTTLPNLTMIGDAAHRMPPYAGEGVNMALQDVFELAECLTSNNFSDIRAAIEHYEKHMQKRASEVTQMTLNSTEMLHADDPINRMLAMFNEMKRN